VNLGLLRCEQSMLVTHVQPSLQVPCYPLRVPAGTVQCRQGDSDVMSAGRLHAASCFCATHVTSFAANRWQCCAACVNISITCRLAPGHRAFPFAQVSPMSWPRDGSCLP
jgi:hypothetical protein